MWPRHPRVLPSFPYLLALPLLGEGRVKAVRCSLWAEPGMAAEESALRQPGPESYSVPAQLEAGGIPGFSVSSARYAELRKRTHVTSSWK